MSFGSHQESPAFRHGECQKSKMHIALKEANETKYWIKHLKIDGFISNEDEMIFMDNVQNIINILISIVNPK